jgi:hypothetical protein
LDIKGCVGKPEGENVADGAFISRDRRGKWVAGKTW